MSGTTLLLLGSLLGLVAGLLVGWVLGKRSSSPDERIENEVRQLLAQRESELARVRSDLNEATSSRAAAEAEKNAAERLLTQQKELQEQTLLETQKAQERSLSD